MTFTGAIGAVCMLPLRAIINASVALGIHPNVLTLIGVLINVAAGEAYYVREALNVHDPVELLTRPMNIYS